MRMIKPGSLTVFPDRIETNDFNWDAEGMAIDMDEMQKKVLRWAIGRLYAELQRYEG